MTREQIYKYLVPLLLLGHLVILAIFAAYRMLGGDEGFYLNATRMVGFGKELYIDFFYTQLMLMPTIFSSFALSGWTSFWILRGFVVLAGFLSAVILFAIVLKLSKSLKSAVVSLFLYSFSGMIISMHTVFEPLVFAHLLSLAVFYFWLLFREKNHPIYLILLGLFLSALINHRAVFIVLLPLYLWSIMRLSETKIMRSLIITLFSMVPFSIPSVLELLRNSQVFFFDTFIFQIHREIDKSIANIATNRFSTILKTILDPHILILLILMAISIWLILKVKRISRFEYLFKSPEGMALMNFLLIAGVYFIPHPILRHYFEQFMAFGIILIGFSLESILKRLGELVKPALERQIILMLALLYVISLAPYIAINIYGIRRPDRRFLLSEVKKVTSKMLQLGRSSDVILSENAGYLFFTGQTPLPYTEIIGFHWPLPISHEEYMKYRLCDSVYLKEQIAKQIPEQVVIVNKPPIYYANELSNGYEHVFQSDVVSIYKRK
jgi:4-amino-4-deoxy-L-arabinose transferase-like glycosyltransferase